MNVGYHGIIEKPLLTTSHRDHSDHLKQEAQQLLLGWPHQHVNAVLGVVLYIAYAQSAYDYNYARLMWIAVEKQCALPVKIFSQYNNLIFAVLEV